MTHRAEAPCASGDDLGEGQDGIVRTKRKLPPGKAVRTRWCSGWPQNMKPRRKQRLANWPNGWIALARLSGSVFPAGGACAFPWLEANVRQTSSLREKRSPLAANRGWTADVYLHVGGLTRVVFGTTVAWN